MHFGISLCALIIYLLDSVCTLHFTENLILPFDKSRSVARKSWLPLISSSRTSLSFVLLHNSDRAAVGKCFSWLIWTDLLCLLPKLPTVFQKAKLKCGYWVLVFLKCGYWVLPVICEGSGREALCGKRKGRKEERK